MENKIIQSFEEISQKEQEVTDKTQPVPTNQLIWVIAGAAALFYLSLTVFLPLILFPGGTVIGAALFFTATFFIATAIYTLAWFAWIRIAQQMGITGWLLGIPLLTLPLSIILFFGLSWLLQTFI